MPRHKKSPSKFRNLEKSDNVTLYDYAHTQGSPNHISDRTRKGVKNAVLTEAHKEFSSCPTETLAALEWHERDLDSYDAEIEALISVKCEVTDVSRTPIKKKRTSSSNTKEEPGNQFPIDFWFLVGNYIRPEDIGRFAGICRATHVVTHTAHFWRSLYKRIHGTRCKSLPLDLQPQSLERIHGLRMRVIRSLHHVHPLFIAPRPGTTFKDNLTTLEGMICQSVSSKKIKSKLWHFYFKFRRRNPGCILDKTNEVETQYEGYELLKGFSDLHHNPDEGCFILQVACSNFTSIPTIMGLNLVSVSVSVSRCMKSHKLKLVLDSRSYITTQTSESVVVSLDPALNAKLHPWWKPSYHNMD